MSTTNKGNNTAILVTTRTFPPRCCNESEFNPIEVSQNFDFIIKGRVFPAIQKDTRRNIYKNNVSNCTNFFNELKNKENPELNIDFDGKIRRIKDSNIFFYYHYPDRQLPEGDRTYLPSAPYIVGLIKEILNIININGDDDSCENSENKINKVILVLHKGDLLGIDLYEGATDYLSFTQQIDKEMGEQKITLQEGVKIYTFSHDISDPIWSQFLSDGDFFNGKNETDPPESYLEKWLDPNEANHYFDKFNFTKE